MRIAAGIPLTGPSSHIVTCTRIYLKVFFFRGIDEYEINESTYTVQVYCTKV
jgi:hypothetical protein